jgi:Flp pilus assembly protein TadB
MTVLYILATLLFAAAIALLLGLTPERIADDFARVLTPEQSLRDMARIAQGRKKSRKLSMEFKAVRDALETIGRAKQFAAVCAASLFLFVGGVVFALLIGNVFLMPVLAVILAASPFLYVKSSLAYYKKHVETEIETALSIISTAYVRSDNIVGAVTENIGYLKPPVKGMFAGFVAETTAINSAIKAALRRLRERIDNQIFREWCDCLLQCQDDRSMKTSLMPIVNKLTDVRIVNNELKTMLSEPRKEYWMMVLLVLGNIPLLYIINRDWFHALMNTVPGKIVLAVCGVVIAVTSVFMAKFTQPIEYKR